MGNKKFKPQFIEIEPIFDEFVATWPGAGRVQNLFADAEKTGLNADYYFENENVIVELKCLERDQSDPSAFAKRLSSALDYLEIHPHDKFRIMVGLEPIPLKAKQRLQSSTQNAMRNALRKANKQLRSTKSFIRKDSSCLLIVANDRDKLFGPIEALKCLAGMALNLSDCHVDGIVYTTPNVFYDDGSGLAKQYWAPVYDEGKEQLGDFVNPLGSAWLDYLGEVVGEPAEKTQVDSLQQSDISARPIRNLSK